MENVDLLDAATDLVSSADYSGLGAAAGLGGAESSSASTWQDALSEAGLDQNGSLLSDDSGAQQPNSDVESGEVASSDSDQNAIDVTDAGPTARNFVAGQGVPKDGETQTTAQAGVTLVADHSRASDPGYRVYNPFGVFIPGTPENDEFTHATENGLKSLGNAIRSPFQTPPSDQTSSGGPAAGLNTTPNAPAPDSTQQIVLPQAANPSVDASGRPADSLGRPLARSQSQSTPMPPPGNCSPKQFFDLQRDVKSFCDAPRKCERSMSFAELQSNLETNVQCAEARDRIIRCVSTVEIWLTAKNLSKPGVELRNAPS